MGTRRFRFEKSEYLRNETGGSVASRPPGVEELCASEVQMQRHLNLACAADGVLGDAKTRRAVKEAIVGAVRIDWQLLVGACLCNSARADSWQRNIVEAWFWFTLFCGTSKLVVLVRLYTSKFVVHLYWSWMRQILGQRSIGAALPGLAEDVALAGGEVGFKGIAVGHAHGPHWNQREREATGLQGRPCVGRRVVEGAVRAGQRVFARAAGGVVQRHDRVGDAVEGAVEDAADGARVVDDAVRLAALDDGRTP
jgi:hypothetical protein